MTQIQFVVRIVMNVRQFVEQLTDSSLQTVAGSLFIVTRSPPLCNPIPRLPRVGKRRPYRVVIQNSGALFFRDAQVLFARASL